MVSLVSKNEHQAHPVEVALHPQAVVLLRVPVGEMLAGAQLYGDAGVPRCRAGLPAVRFCVMLHYTARDGPTEARRRLSRGPHGMLQVSTSCTDQLR